MSNGAGSGCGSGVQEEHVGLERTWTQEQPRFILVSGKRFLNLHAELFAAFVPDPENRIDLKY